MPSDCTRVALLELRFDGGTVTEVTGCVCNGALKKCVARCGVDVFLAEGTCPSTEPVGDLGPDELLRVALEAPPRYARVAAEMLGDEGLFLLTAGGVPDEGGVPGERERRDVED